MKTYVNGRKQTNLPFLHEVSRVGYPSMVVVAVEDLLNYLRSMMVQMKR